MPTEKFRKNLAFPRNQGEHFNTISKGLTLANGHLKKIFGPEYCLDYQKGLIKGKGRYKEVVIGGGKLRYIMGFPELEVLCPDTGEALACEGMEATLFHNLIALDYIRHAFRVLILSKTEDDEAADEDEGEEEGEESDALEGNGEGQSEPAAAEPAPAAKAAVKPLDPGVAKLEAECRLYEEYIAHLKEFVKTNNLEKVERLLAALAPDGLRLPEPKTAG